MKQFRHIAILAVVATLAGCAKTEVISVPEQQMISFNVGSYTPSTKAQAALHTETETFSSKAFLHAEGVTGTQDFFGTGGETIRYYSSVPEWAPESHPYYWPKGEQSYINFVSWYDPNGAPTTATETSLVWSARSIVADDNIMYADEAWRYHSNVSPATFTSVSGVSEGVPTLFHHALAKVRFRARATQLDDIDGTSWTVKVTEISVSGIYETGTLAMTNSDPSSTSTKAWTAQGSSLAPSWSTSGDTAGFSSTGEWTLQDKSTGGSYVTLIDSRSVLPQTVTDNMKLTINYDVTTSYTGKTIKESVSSTVSLNSFTDAPLAWDMNKILTYNIEINPATDTILFDPEMTDWTLESVQDLIIE